MQQPDNAFRQFWRKGYTRLIPITVPGAPVSERSSLFKRQKDMGKAPGVLRADKTWQGVDWMKLEAAEADLDVWAGWGAGTGLRLGGGFLAIDIDTLSKDAGDVCGQLATKHLGASENRIGRAPKRLKLYRIAEDVAYRRLSFDGGHVELLGEGKQCVVAGIHPVTGQPYEWPRGVPAAKDLPLVTPAQLDAYFKALAEKLPAAKDERSSLPTDTRVDPTQLTGKEHDVRRAIEALPNTSKQFPTYASYIEVAQAIKGALPDDPEQGLELFQAWAAKWEGGNDPDRVAADYGRCQPSRSLGAAYLYSLAEKHGAGAFQAAETWFTGTPATEADLNAFKAEEPPALEPIRWVRPSDWSGEPPAREWEVKDWIPRGEVVLLYGEGGVGKTLLAHQYAICAATGINWLGQQTRQAKVMCFFCEDGEDELHRRHRDISQSLGVDPAASDARLRIASRKYGDNLLALWDRNTGAMRKTAVWEQLRGDAMLFGADVIIVDTLADTFGGSEIDRSQVNSFVKSCLGRLAQEVGATVIALGHPSVGGRAEGRSGSTAWSNAARSRLYLRYPKGKDTGNWRELEGMKLNYGPKGNQIRLRWNAGAFEAVSARQPEIDLNAKKESSVVVASVLPSTDSENEAAVLRILVEAAEEGLALNLSPRSHAYAPRVLKQAYGRALDLVKAEEIHEAIVALQARGIVRATEFWSGRNKVPGFAIVPGAAPVASAATDRDWFQPVGGVLD